MLADHRAAGFRVPLAVALANMKHKAKGHSQHQIERPGDKAPVKQRENPSPFHNGAAHFRQVRVGCVHDPLRKGIEQDVCGQPAGEHHASPGEEGILWLFIGLAQYDVPILGQRQEQGNQQHTQTNDQIIDTHGVAYKEAHLSDHSV